MSIDAMKQALRAAEFADLCIKELVTGSTNREVAKQVLSEAITALRAAIEQAQDPVAWMTFNAVGDEDDIWYEHPDGQLPEGWTYKPLYTAPRREWQGLTDEDKDSFWRADQMTSQEWGELFNAIEAKLREKNA